MRPLKKAVLALGLSLAASTALAGTPVATDTWYWFDAYSDVTDAPWVDENYDPLEFDVTLARAAVLLVVDNGYTGDRYEVFANGVSLGLTSVPGNAGDTFLFDFDDAAADQRWSHGEFVLAAGTYSITGRAVSFAPDTFAASGGLMLTPVPEPGTFALLGAGGILILGALRRQAK